MKPGPCAESGPSCSLDLECANGYCATEGQCPGACAPRGKAGDTCTPRGCADGLRCITNLQDAGHCVESVGLGETCSAQQPCRGYTVCAGLGDNTVNDTGTCATRASLRTVKQGELCESLDDLLCEENLVCATTLENGIVVGRCQPKAKSGAACTYSTPDQCPNGEYCRISSATGVKPATGECRKSPLVGEECRYGTVFSATCPVNAYCDIDSKVCTRTKALDEACSRASDCASRSCRDGKCALNLDCSTDN